ncbi:hypothetical protein CsSME_00005777 [Camellia sinensis var. sinensis]
MMMINKSCIEGCILDVQSPLPLEKRHMKLYQWAQADKEFLRLLTKNKQEEGSSSSSSAPSPSPSFSSSSSSSSPPPLGYARPPTNLHESYAWRQRYLRSYTFSTKKQTTAAKTKKWLSAKKKNYLIKPNNDPKVKKVSENGSCSFIDALFKFVFLCVAKVDVHEN